MIKTMDAMTGYAIFRKYTSNSRKGVRNADGTFDDRMNLGGGFPASKDVLRGTLSNGKPQSEYTSSVIEMNAVELKASTDVVLRWSPIVPGSIFAQDTTYTYADDGAGHLVQYTTANIDIVKINGVRSFFTKGTTTPATPTDADCGAVDYGSFRDSGFADQGKTTVFGKITPEAGFTTATVALEYQYNNEFIPQNDIPLIGVTTEQVYLHAKVRRIAIYYSQLAEFEAQKDYSFSLGDDLRKQAEFQLQFKHFWTLAA